MRGLEPHDIGEYRLAEYVGPIIVLVFVFGDGSVGADAVFFKKAVLYASRTSRSKGAAHNTYSPFDLKFMHLHYSGTVVVELWKPSELPPKVHPEDFPRYGPFAWFRAVELRKQALIQEKLKGAMVEFLKEHARVRLVVASPGARPDIPNVQDLFVKGHDRVWKAQRDDNCLLAALTNAIDIVLGRDDGRYFCNQAQVAALSCPKMSAVPIVFQRFRVRLEARKLTKEMRATMASQPCQTLATGQERRLHCVPRGSGRAMCGS